MDLQYLFSKSSEILQTLPGVTLCYPKTVPNGWKILAHRLTKSHFSWPKKHPQSVQVHVDNTLEYSEFMSFYVMSCFLISWLLSLRIKHTLLVNVENWKASLHGFAICMPSPALGFCFACYPSLKRSMLEACLAPAALSWTAVSRKSTKNTGPQRAPPAMWAIVPPGWFYANGFVSLNRDSNRYESEPFQQPQGGAWAKLRQKRTIEERIV